MLKIDGATLPLPHTFSWLDAYLIKNRGEFTFRSVLQTPLLKVL
jgi:hypothetical protein